VCHCCDMQVRSIQFNLKDVNNPDLRRRVLTGQVDPQVRLITTQACQAGTCCQWPGMLQDPCSIPSLSA